MPVVGIDFGLFSEPAMGQVFILDKKNPQITQIDAD